MQNQSRKAKKNTYKQNVYLKDPINKKIHSLLVYLSRLKRLGHLDKAQKVQKQLDELRLKKQQMKLEAMMQEYQNKYSGNS